MTDAFNTARASAAMIMAHAVSPLQHSAVPPGRPEPATRQGQIEIVAATLAAAVIAAGRERVTVEQAVERFREVLAVLAKG